MLYKFFKIFFTLILSIFFNDSSVSAQSKIGYKKVEPGYYPNNDTLELGEFVFAHIESENSLIQNFELTKPENTNLIVFECNVLKGKKLNMTCKRGTLPAFYKSIIKDLFEILGFDDRLTYNYKISYGYLDDIKKITFNFFWENQPIKNINLHIPIYRKSVKIYFSSFNAYSKLTYNSYEGFYQAKKEILFIEGERVIFHPIWSVYKQVYNKFYIASNIDYNISIIPLALEYFKIDIECDSIYSSYIPINPMSCFPTGLFKHEFVKDGVFNPNICLTTSSRSQIGGPSVVTVNKILKEPKIKEDKYCKFATYLKPHIEYQFYDMSYSSYFEMLLSRDYYYNKKNKVVDTILNITKSFLEFDECQYQLKSIESDDPETINFQLFYKGYKVENSVWQIFNDQFYTKYSNKPFRIQGPGTQAEYYVEKESIMCHIAGRYPRLNNLNINIAINEKEALSIAMKHCVNKNLDFKHNYCLKPELKIVYMIGQSGYTLAYCYDSIGDLKGVLAVLANSGKAMYYDCNSICKKILKRNFIPDEKL